jgi:hypothetical protein
MYLNQWNLQTRPKIIEKLVKYVKYFKSENEFNIVATQICKRKNKNFQKKVCLVP